MQQLNRVELIGLVGSVSVQEFSGAKQARFSLATNYAYKDHEGSCVIDTSWHNVIAWEGRNMPDLLMIHKGSRLHVLGRIRYQKYVDVNGIDRTSTEILANKIEVLDDNEPITYQQ